MNESLTLPPDYFEQIFRTIASEVEVLDTRSFQHGTLGYFGSRPEPVGRETAPVDAGGTPPNLWQFIYFYYYDGDEQAALDLRSSASVVTLVHDREDAAFAERLQAACSGRGYFELGWEVRAIEPDAVRVRRGGITLKARADEVRPAVGLAEGDSVAVHFPNARRYAQAGRFLMIGDAGSCQQEHEPLARIYFSIVGAERAPDFMQALATALNDAGLPFQCKIMNNPDSFTRRDAAVLYLYASDWRLHQQTIDAVAGRFSDCFQDAVPCFALPLGPGWSYAEEPTGVTGAVSFGQHRSLLAAEGLTNAYRDGGQTPDARFDAIVARFYEEGLDVQRPYLTRESLRECARGVR